MRKPTERYIGWYGMRMLTASRDRTKCQMNRKCSNEVNRWMSSVPNTDKVKWGNFDTGVTLTYLLPMIAHVQRFRKMSSICTIR